ncbi:MAG: amino acid dehydrogenase [Hyphomicrobiales bacterium]|nr:FAD-binding oxidoreductase [Hyphomicrobiales bacterium]PCH51535.1 MAG: amino acid dehydrogenase [Hyphomicrobiales bacterium]
MKNVEIDVIVIGAGVVGMSCALALQKRGLSIKILERKTIASEASFGNAGAFAFSEILPLAKPSLFLKAPKWLLDPMGPLSIPPAYALKVMPWMLRFLRSAFSDKFNKSVVGQASLMKFCESTIEGHIDNVGANNMLRHEGQLQLYESERQWLAERECWQIWERHGIEFEHLHSAEEIANLQPGVSSRFTHGTFTPAWRSIRDPFVYTKHLAKVFLEHGGIIGYENVSDLEHYPDYVCVVAEHKKYSAKHVVIAAGAWSHKLAKMLGENIPLETQRGYNTTLSSGAFDLKMHLTFPEHGFVVSKIGDGIRVGGAVEMGGLKLPPNYKRSEFMLDKAKRFLPELNSENGTQWMGFRPCLPDSLPVIGSAKNACNVIYAFGHGHLGLTQSAGTGELVSELVMGLKPSIDLTPFSARRF